MCAEVNQKAREDAVAANDPIGARERFTTEHMRLRWSYLHLLVSTARKRQPMLILFFYCSAKSAKNRPITHWTGKSRSSHLNRRLAARLQARLKALPTRAERSSAKKTEIQMLEEVGSHHMQNRAKNHPMQASRRQCWPHLARSAT